MLLSTVWGIVREPRSVVAIVMLVVITLAGLCAPLYAQFVSGVDPFSANVTGTVTLHGEEVPVIGIRDGALAPTPIGPTWQAAFFMGADSLGRDLVTRVLYGTGNSLFIGLTAALIICVVGGVLGTLGGYFGGWVDTVISRILDIVWAFPFYVLAISLATVLLVADIHIGEFRVNPGSLWIPILVIAYVFLPFVGRPARAVAMSLRKREFIQAAQLTGASQPRIWFTEIVPNALPTILTMFPIMASRVILVEASLSFLGVGVQVPKASWGNLIEEGRELLLTRPLISVLPGVAFTLTLIALTLLGDVFRERLDPSARQIGSSQ